MNEYVNSILINQANGFAQRVILCQTEIFSKNNYQKFDFQKSFLALLRVYP